jgi:hypothetical protein
MTKKQATTKEAEDFVRRAISHLAEKPVSETAIKKAAQKVTKALPRLETRERVDA